MKAYTESNIPQRALYHDEYIGQDSVPFIAFYPDDEEMVEDARCIYNDMVKNGLKPIVIAGTGRWRFIKHFNDAYGCVQRRVYFVN